MTEKDKGGFVVGSLVKIKNVREKDEIGIIITEKVFKEFRSKYLVVIFYGSSDMTTYLIILGRQTIWLAKATVDCLELVCSKEDIVGKTGFQFQNITFAFSGEQLEDLDILKTYLLENRVSDVISDKEQELFSVFQQLNI